MFFVFVKGNFDIKLTFRKLQPDVLRFMDYKLQSVTNRGKYMSDEKYESSNLADYKYNNGIDGEIPFDPVMYEVIVFIFFFFFIHTQ